MQIQWRGLSVRGVTKPRLLCLTFCSQRVLMLFKQAMKSNMFMRLWILLLLFSGFHNICCEKIMVNSTDMLSLLDFKQSIINSGVIMSNWNRSTSLCQWNGVKCSPKHPGRVTGLELSGQGLSGPIAASTGNLTALRTLDLSSNHFSGHIPNLGTIPLNFGNITHAERISAGYNDLTGSIPQGLWKLPNLLVLELGGNMLSGGIPQVLFNQSSLWMLALESNKLNGVLPSNIGDAFPNLQLLLLVGNMFQGHIPASLGNASKLLVLDFPKNNFTGEIPSSLGKLRNISFLIFENNSLEATDRQSWEFFPALTNCTQLNVLSLSRNQLAGIIPDSVGNFSSNLEHLLLGGNKLSGTVPPSVGNLQSLIELGLDDSNLSSTIENWVGRLTQLQILRLQMNSFTGL